MSIDGVNKAPSNLSAGSVNSGKGGKEGSSKGSAKGSGKGSAKGSAKSDGSSSAQSIREGVHNSPGDFEDSDMDMDESTVVYGRS